ncbi:MAG TPA: NAD+ synthase [Kouleothrix sp.]|nr:NAD+ synthase [Kouleothrix sp.]HRC75473.1 NAD+ synthase [Kouleothrix sp.]
MPIQIAIAQLRPKKGDYDANIARLGAIFAQLAALDPQPDVLVLPETFLSGYFLEGGVREVARPAGQVYADINQRYLAASGPAARPLDIAVGFYERYRDRFYNSALYATLGSADASQKTQDQASAIGEAAFGHPSLVLRPGIRHVHRKVFLPTYGVFDEARFVEAGRQVLAFDTRFGRAALLICEDAWHSISGTVAALDGAQVVYVVSASPARGIATPRPANVEHWDELLYRIADEHGVFGVLAQLVGFEGGKGFPGGSLAIGPRGNFLVRGPLWDEALVTATLDLAELPIARADQPLLADLETMLPHLQNELARTQRGEAGLVRWDAPHPQRGPTSQAGGESERATGPTASPSACLPVVAAAKFDPSADFLRIDAAAVRRWLVAFLRDEVARRRGFADVVVGLSGGVDSALVTYLCAEAFGAEHVLALRMPYRTSSRESLEHAQLCIDALGVRSLTLDISDAVDGYARLDPTIDGRRKGNIMARTRMIALFDQSQRLGCIPVGTGNKTERLFGYYTWHADDSPPVNPLGDLFKSQVWQLARHVGVPDVIVAKPASADLIVGQTDEADFGISYPLADQILHFLLAGYNPAGIAALGFRPDDVALVKRRLDSTHWKRHLPSTAMLSATAIGEYYLRPLDY